MTEPTDAQLVQKLLNDIAPYLAIRGMAHMADAAVCAAQRLEARGEITWAMTQAAALGIINARRAQNGLGAIEWDCPSLTERDRGLAMEQARAALEAVKEPSP